MKALIRESALKNKKTSAVLAILVMFFWGSLFPMIKIGYRSFGVDTSSVSSILLFAGIRFILCGMILLAASVRENGKLQLPTRGSVGPILAVALFAYILHYTCTYIGVSKLDSSKTAVIKQVGTLFIVCFAFLFRKEDRFTVQKLIGGLLGFASILVVNLNGRQWSMSPYDLLVIAASFCSVIGIIISKNAYDKQKPLVITGWSQLTGGTVLFLAGLITGGQFTEFTGMSVLVLAYMCFASCMGYALWNMLLRYQDMSRLNTVKFAESFFSSFCSWILLGENIFRPEFLVSLVLVCLGIIICQSKRRVHP